MYFYVLGQKELATCFIAVVAKLATTMIHQQLFCLKAYEVHIWYGGSSGQWRLGTHPVAMAAWLPWQPQ